MVLESKLNNFIGTLARGANILQPVRLESGTAKCEGWSSNKNLFITKLCLEEITIFLVIIVVLTLVYGFIIEETESDKREGQGNSVRRKTLERQ